MQEQQTAKAPEMVFLRHPHTGDVQEVEATPERLTPLMIQGYVQFTPAAPAKAD